jgi:hypothetical protein
MLMFLKHLGLANFLIIKGSNLCKPLVFAHKAIESHSLFFLCPERHLVAKVLSGSNL